jgi:hypothetical protein
MLVTGSNCALGHGYRIEAGYRAAETGQTQESRTSFEPLSVEAS